MIRQPHPGEICLLLSLGLKVLFHRTWRYVLFPVRAEPDLPRILVFVLFAEGIAGAPNRMNQALPKWEVDLRTQLPNVDVHNVG